MLSLWSNRCLVCQSRLTDDFAVCAGCCHHLQPPDSVCLGCGLDLSPTDQANWLLCGQCQISPPPYAQLSACCCWNEVVQILVHRLKYGGDLVCARVFGQLLARAMLTGNRASNAVLVPVPLSWRRLYQRGYNQAEEIARWAQYYRLGTVADTGIRRHRHTQAQSQLPAAQRRANIRDCFSAPPRERTQPTEVIIVDDLVTTACTVSEMSKTLSRAGYRVRGVWCLARVPP
ncbi:MAG: ComF family protein [Gammaproteobacteria bacterium]|nr:ComF family protein [Gammaproteobacteria bacterium]